MCVPKFNQTGICIYLCVFFLPFFSFLWCVLFSFQSKCLRQLNHGFAQHIPRVFWTANVWCNEHGWVLCVCVCSMSRGTLWTAVSDAMHVRERSALQSSWWPMYLQRGMDRPALRQRWEPLVAVQSWQAEWICSFICWQIQGWNSEVNSPAVLMGERVRSSVAISPRTQKHLILRALIDRWWLVFVRR